MEQPKNQTLYLVRHGQTLFNSRQKIQGWSDSPLTEHGIQQAKNVGTFFREQGVQFDHAYSSTSERACDTLELITSGLMPYTRLKGLKEQHFGAFEGADQSLFPVFPYGDFFKAYGGEDSDTFVKRVCGTIKDIMDSPNHQNVLIVSHGVCCFQFYLAWEKYAVVRREKPFQNCCIMKYEYDGNIFSLLEIKNDF